MTIDRSACADDCTHPHHREPQMPPPTKARPNRGILKHQASEAAKVNTAHPPCLGCKGTVAPKIGEVFSKWMRRSYCTVACKSANQPQSLAAQERSAEATAAHLPCTVCGRPVVRRKGQNLTKYRECATCGQEACARAHHAAALRARNESIAEQKAIDREMRLAAEEAAEARAMGDVDYGKGFGPHNIVPPVSEGFGRIGGRPLTSSYGISEIWR